MSRIEDMEQVAGQAEGPSGTRRSLKPQISEALLSRLWGERASRHSLFVTNRGHKIKVLYPGRPNPSSGPDYKDALFYQDGLGLVRGNVELHLSVRDWRAHGHHLDASYNGVTLHVVAGEADKDASLNNGLGTPAISLAPPFKTQQPGPDVAPDALGKILSKAGFPRPSSRQEALQLLERAGVARFLVKSASYQRQMRVQPAQEVIYQALMEAAGYSENRTGFLQLAQKATYALLMRLASAGPPKISLATVEDYLLQAAGFKNTSDRSGFWGTPVAPDCWRLFRVRPSNHPRRRVRGMAHLVVRFREAALVGGLKLLLLQENRRLVERGMAVEDPDGGPALIGSSRARDMAVNVVLPTLHAWGQENKDEALQRVTLKLFRDWPSLQKNNIVGSTEEALFPTRWLPLARGACQQQGVLHLQRLLAG